MARHRVHGDDSVPARIPHTNVQQKLHVQLAAATPAVIRVENCYESIADIWEAPISQKTGYCELPQKPEVVLKLTDAAAKAARVA